MTGAPHVAACGHAGHAVCADCPVRSISVCAALEESELRALSIIAQDLDFEAGAEIVQQDEPAIALFNITEGVARLLRVLSDGRRQIVGFLYPGDFLGLSLAPLSAFAAQAVGPVRACRFERRRFEAIVASHPKLLKRLHEAAAHELTLAQEHMVVLGRQTAEERLAHFLATLRARRRAAGFEDDFVPLPMARQDIADHLGLTIETVSRTMTRLAASGTVRVARGGVEVVSLRRLEDLAAL